MTCEENGEKQQFKAKWIHWKILKHDNTNKLTKTKLSRRHLQNAILSLGIYKP